MGVVTDVYSYTPFGEPTHLLGSTSNTYLYIGQQYDETTGVYNLRARYYDPSLGRFLSADTYPINYQNPAEFNRYIYTANNPVNFIDPSGLVSFVETAFNNIKVVAYNAAKRPLEYWAKDFAFGFIGGVAGWVLGKGIGILLNYGLQNIPQGLDALAGYPGNNDILYELWASVGVGIDFLWAGLLGGLAEVTNGVLNVARLLYLSYEEIQNLSIVASAMKTSVLVSLLNFIKPIIDNIFTVIPYNSAVAGSFSEAELRYHKEILTDFFVETLNVIITGLIAGATAKLSQPFTESFAQSVANNTFGLPGSFGFATLVPAGIANGLTLALRDQIDQRV